MALWNDRVPISDAELHSGTVELTVNGVAAATINLSVTANLTTSTTTYTPLAVTNNPQNRGVDYRLTGSTGNSAVAGLEAGLAMSIRLPSIAGSCTGTLGATLRAAGPLDGATFAGRPLANGATETLCVGITTLPVTSTAFWPGAATLDLKFMAVNR